MKGYATSEGYMGLVQGRYMLFASEVDYREDKILLKLGGRLHV